MKYLFASAIFFCSLVLAEPSFDQIESLIEKQNYSAAAMGLEEIIRNHPHSAKAYYAMAQAQAGLGNLEKARYAMDKATGLQPDLSSFASSSKVDHLREAITPQTAKIESIQESHFWRNLFIALLIAGIGYWIYYLMNKKDDDEDKPTAKAPPEPVKPAPTKAPTYDLKVEQAAASTTWANQKSFSPPPPLPTQTPQPVYVAPAQPVTVHVATPAPQASVANDLAAALVISEMLSHNHEHTRVVEREVIRETPSRSSSWDDDSSSSSSASSSSSWDSDSSSSSSSSSSWDSSSSSSDSSSSWDSSDSSSSSW